MTGTGARLHLLLAEQPTGFDLMAECALCGAMTEQPLSVVWGCDPSAVRIAAL